MDAKQIHFLELLYKSLLTSSAKEQILNDLDKYSAEQVGRLYDLLEAAEQTRQKEQIRLMVEVKNITGER